MRKRDVLHFSPDPVAEALQNLEEFTVDSNLISSFYLDYRNQNMDPRTAAAYRKQRERATTMLRGVAFLEDDLFASKHVTENESLVLEMLKGGTHQIDPSDACEGLEVTLAIDYRTRGAKGQWDFLPGLDVDQKEVLWKRVREILLNHVTTHYITESEYAYAMRGLDEWLNGDFSDWGIRAVAAQPYNINVRELAVREKMVDPFVPTVLDVEFEGRYLDLTGQDVQDETYYLASHVLGKDRVDSDEVCAVLRGKGWDGIFTGTLMGTNSHLAIWNLDKIMRFGGWSREKGASLSGAGSLVECRFECPGGTIKDEFRVNVRNGETGNQACKRFIMDRYGLDEYQFSLCKKIQVRYIE